MKENKLPNSYFPHDFNARFDRKILRCRKVLGIEGYGIFWMLIETLCLQENFSYPLKDIDLLADDFGCSVEKVEAVVKQFELFQIDKEARFFSLSLIARMQKYLELSEKARHSVNIRWDKARKLKELQQNNTVVLLPNNDSNTIKEKNKKEKKKTEKKIIEISDSDFNYFWDSYDKKVNKPNSIKEWNKLTDEEKEKIFQILPAYINSKPDKQFRLDPERFLKRKSFNDEIIEGSNGTNKNNGGATPQQLAAIVARRFAREQEGN